VFTWQTGKFVAFLGALVLITSPFVLYYFLGYDWPCEDHGWVHESRTVTRAESQELLAALLRVFEADRASRNAGELSRPLSIISISGKTATLEIASTVTKGDERYLQNWLDIYQIHHPQQHAWCTTIVFRSPSGTVTQNCCHTTSPL
jgi:hypothetical protein